MYLAIDQTPKVVLVPFGSTIALFSHTFEISCYTSKDLELIASATSLNLLLALA